MKRRIATFKVELRLREDASVAEAKQYIEEAVSSWGGSLRPPGSLNENDPGDPFFALDETDVRVTRYRKPRRNIP